MFDPTSILMFFRGIIGHRGAGRPEDGARNSKKDQDLLNRINSGQLRDARIVEQSNQQVNQPSTGSRPQQGYDVMQPIPTESSGSRQPPNQS